MSSYLRYSSRQIVEAKQLDRGLGLFNPRTSERQQARAGDYLVKAAGRPDRPDRIVPQELFGREYEPESWFCIGSSPLTALGANEN